MDADPGCADDNDRTTENHSNLTYFAANTCSSDETLTRPFMRAPFLLVPITLMTLASMAVAAQEAPRVIFCTGQCFAVDQGGVRTPAPKGTTLREGQRLETGPGAYAQLKLGPYAALAVAERARVSFDQRSLRDRDVVFVDQGRIRMLSGEALGGPEKRGVELRTVDGVFALRGADIELRKAAVSASSGSGLTIVNLNAGNARLLNPGGELAISKGGVQGFTAGKVVTDRPISLGDIAFAPSRPGVAAIAPAAFVPAAVVTGADKVMLTPMVDPASPTRTTTLTQVVRSTTLAPTTVLSPITNTLTSTPILLLKTF